MSATLSKPSTQHQPAFSRLVRYLLLLLWIGFMTYASTNVFSSSNTSRFVGPVLLWLFPHITLETLAATHLLIRKASHLGEYAVLGILAARAFKGSSQTVLQRHWFLAALLLIMIYALVDEYHQSFVPSRTGSIFDSLIDTTGGVAALIFLRRRWKVA